MKTNKDDYDIRDADPVRIKGKEGWWLFPHSPPIGPYDTIKEALEAKRSLVQTFLNRNDPEFFHCEAELKDVRLQEHYKKRSRKSI